MAVITISRQSGSEGNEITRLLCKRLGYQYFDKALMIDFAAKLGIQPDQVVDLSADQYQARGFWERAFGSFQMPFGDPSGWALAVQQDILEEISLQQIRQMITFAYERDNVVIVGRGGQIVLADQPNVLHVRVVAPLETRIARWQKRENLSYDEARARVREHDAAHIDFIKCFYNADLNDPALYDLVINTEKITPEMAVDLIVKVAETIHKHP